MKVISNNYIKARGEAEGVGRERDRQTDRDREREREKVGEGGRWKHSLTVFF